MTLENFSYIIAIILLISSIISPIMTAVINNRHQLNIKKLEIYESSKKQALNDFVEATVNLHKNRTLGTIDKFYQAVNCLYLYFDNIPSNITNLISYSNNTDELFNELSKIVQDISKQIKKE